MDEPLRARRALAGLPAVAVAIALSLFGIGGIAGAASGAGSKNPISSGASRGVRLTATAPIGKCLEAHGVKLPKRGDFSKNFKGSKKFKPPRNFKGSKKFKPPRNFKGSKKFKPPKLSKKLEAALKACGAKPATFFGGSSSNAAARASASKAYLSCLSDNGVKVSKKDEKSGKLTGLSSQSKFPAANKKCSVLLPTRTATTGS